MTHAAHSEQDSGGIRFNYAAIVAVAGIISLWCIGILPLVDRYYLHSFEPDISKTVEFTTRFRDFLVWPDPRNLPAISDYPPYLDGQYFVYAVSADIVSGLRKIGFVSRLSVPTDESTIIFGIRWLHMLCHLASVIVLFLACLHLTKNVTVAFMAGVLLLFSMESLDIDFLRVDHLILSLFILLVYLAIAVKNAEDVPRIKIVFALVAALLATTKITSIALIFPPAWLLFANSPNPQRTLRSFRIPLFVGAVFAGFLSVRYLLHPLEVIPNLFAKFESVQEWKGVLSRHPYGYYLWDLFQTNGILFPVLAIAGGLTTAISVPFRQKCDPYAIFLSGTLIVFGALSVAVFKYVRGGYHFVPIYILCLVNFILLLESLLKELNFSKSFDSTMRHLLPIAILLIFACGSNSSYAELRQSSASLAASIDITRTQPMAWLEAHFPLGTRIVIEKHSEWALPPMSESGYHLKYAFLDIPYLDPRALAAYPPPDLATIRRTADVIVLNNFHPQTYTKFIRDFGLSDMANRWVVFFNHTLTQFPTYQFISPSSGYYVSEVRIIVVNASRAISPLPPPGKIRPFVF